MDINEFAIYCIDNATNIYIVEFGKVTSLAEARNKTRQMWKLWATLYQGGFAGNKKEP